MKILKVKTFTDADYFTANYKCEQCGRVVENMIFFDSDYFQKLMSNATCYGCGLNSLGESYEETKYRLGKGFKA